MFMAVTFVTLLTTIPFGESIFRTCVPNTQFLLNGRLCYCNSMGRWSEATCQMIGRRQTCLPGQIIWEECSQCICQDNGKLMCTNTECAEDSTRKNFTKQEAGTELWCTPFRSYYINCSLCVCPASGKMSEARCATDSSCSLKGPNLSMDSLTQSVCIPKVMYLFTCLHCLCSDDGLFVQSKCVETCHKLPESTKRCIPRTFYRVDCNVYRCPDNGVPDEDIKTKSSCLKQRDPLKSLVSLRNITTACTPNKYTKPKCIYCECSSQAVVNESSCLEQECLKINNFHYDSVKSTCSPGELVPMCMECFCLRHGFTVEKYCTRVCSLQNKLIMLERVLKETISEIERSVIKDILGREKCEPSSVFIDQGRYCLCPDNGNTNFKLCTSVTDDSGPKKTQRFIVDKANAIDYNITCEPNTFVEFGCNTCYCTKAGKVEEKWCTFDDCDAKKTIQESHKDHDAPKYTTYSTESLVTCVPGSITKVDCNFCICSASGLVKERACTNNTCSGPSKPMSNEFACEPSAYYTVDCNTCFCGTDGIKNIDKCTKNQCERNFLRSESCTSGELFSDDCNICVCPPNGNKNDKACTNRTCADVDTPWKKIFQLSQSLLDNQVEDDTVRNLEVCFPGEEFESGCKLCVCPEMGLKEYASCTPVLCNNDKLESTGSRIAVNDSKKKSMFDSAEEIKTKVGKGEGKIYDSEDIFEKDLVGGYDDNDSSDEIPDDRSIGDLVGTDRAADEFKNLTISDSRRSSCSLHNYNIKAERRLCTPGSQYIIRCRICMCPYLGNINNFCRPMPPEQYCEQAFPNYNYISMGRRTENETTANATEIKYPIQIRLPHNHTMYKCEKPGNLTDECFICECEPGRVLVEEHCYKSDSDACTDATPTFIKAGDDPVAFERFIS